MTTQKFTRLIAILALSALAFSACKKDGANSNNSNNTNNTSNTAANKSAPTTPTTGDYSSPTATFKTFYEAAKANNIEGIKRSMSKKTMEEIAKDAAGEKKAVDDLLKEMVKDAPSSVPAMRNEKVEGDKATLEVKDDKMDKWNPVHFVKEDGQWKLAIRDESAASMEGMDHTDGEKK